MHLWLKICKSCGNSDVLVICHYCPDVKKFIFKRLHDEGWYRGTDTDSPLIIEKQGCALKLVSGPDYQPSFQRGLHTAQILKTVLGVNKVSSKNMADYR